MTSTPILNALSIVVTDMARSLAFYRTSGLPLPADADGDNENHVEATIAGGVRIMFDTVDVVRSFDPSWTPPTGGHRMAMAFACDTPADVDAVHRQLVDAGSESHLAPFDAVWGQRYAVVNDPDGNPVDFYAPLG